MGIIISTDRLIASSEARKQIGQLLDNIQKDEGNYYVILENGKVAAVLIHPNWLKEKSGEEFPSLEKIRKEWSRNTKDVTEALDALEKVEENDLPALLK